MFDERFVTVPFGGAKRRQRLERDRGFLVKQINRVPHLLFDRVNKVVALLLHFRGVGGENSAALGERDDRAEDCGPFRTDHFQYVFQNERPKPNLNRGAGLDVSPAVRDYLGLSPTDVTDWQFVEVRDVPPGPWRNFGDNNHFVIAKRQAEQRIVQEATDKKKKE